MLLSMTTVLGDHITPRTCFSRQQSFFLWDECATLCVLMLLAQCVNECGKWI